MFNLLSHQSYQEFWLNKRTSQHKLRSQDPCSKISKISFNLMPFWANGTGAKVVHGLIPWVIPMGWFHGFFLWADSMGFSYGMIPWVFPMGWFHEFSLWVDSMGFFFMSWFHGILFFSHFHLVELRISKHSLNNVERAYFSNINQTYLHLHSQFIKKAKWLSISMPTKTILW